MNIYHIEFAKTSQGLSGGEVCMVELIKYFQSQGHKNILLTTDNGKETYLKEIPEDNLIVYKTISSYKDEQRYGVFLSYILRTFRAVKMIKMLHLESKDLVICHSEFFPNSIPAWVINKKNTSSKSANIFHMRAPSLFRGYEGEFTGRHQFPQLTILHYLLNQWLYRLLSSPKTIIFTVNTYYKKYLERKYPKNRVVVLEHFGGISSSIEIGKMHPRKKFDLIWVGRFHPQKGLQDLARVIQQASLNKPNLKAIIIGDGPAKIKKQFINQLIALGIRDNVYLAGFVGGEEKFKYLLISRVFVMPSYYESVAVVILEAMTCGLPVVTYNLPPYEVFKDGIVKVPILDYIDMSRQAITLLEDKEKYARMKAKSQKIASEHSWAATGNDILKEF